MRSWFETYRGKQAGLYGLGGPAVRLVEIENVFDDHVAFLNVEDRTKIHVPYASIKAILECEHGVRWGPSIFRKRQPYKILVHLGISGQIVS